MGDESETGKFGLDFMPNIRKLWSVLHIIFGKSVDISRERGEEEWTRRDKAIEAVDNHAIADNDDADAAYA